MENYYSVGKDELCGRDFSYITDNDKTDIEWIVYHYTSDWYEGSGEAIVKKDNKYYYYDLGHCSCYGPLEGSPTEHSLQEILSDKDNVHDFDVCQEIKDKIRELENVV